MTKMTLRQWTRAFPQKLRSRFAPGGEYPCFPVPVKDNARPLKPQSGAATTTSATAAATNRVARRLRLVRWLVSILAVGAIAGLAGSSPAPVAERAESAPGHVSRTVSAGSAAISPPPPESGAVFVAGHVRLDTAPPRQPARLGLVRNGWRYDCMECHALRSSKWHYGRLLNEHQGVELDHGNNRFCLNCHHPTNRNAYVDYDGTEIPQEDTLQLCGKCHGTTFRDWQAGVHGRQNGYWDPAAGEKTRLRCVQCHAPHRPKFPDMQPLPPLRYPPRAAHPPAAMHALIIAEANPQ
jgi:hypothetical protein